MTDARSDEKKFERSWAGQMHTLKGMLGNILLKLKDKHKNEIELIGAVEHLKQRITLSVEEFRTNQPTAEQQERRKLAYLYAINFLLMIIKESEDKLKEANAYPTFVIKEFKRAENFLQGIAESCTFSELKNHTEESFASSLEGNKLTIQIKDPDLVNTIIKEGDYVSIVSDIIENGIANSIRFTKKGNITVTIESSADKAHFIIKIMDTGCGMSKEVLAEVKAGRKVTTGGIGVGLAEINDRLVHFGGKRDVESELGTGTTFSYIFPKNTMLGGKKTIRSPVTSPWSNRFFDANGKELLYLYQCDEKQKPDPTDTRSAIYFVDDDPTSRKTFARIMATNLPQLLKSDCFIQTFSTAAAAIAEYKQNPGRVIGIVMDKHLKGENGVESIESIRKFDKTIPMYLYTADVEPSDGSNKSISGIIEKGQPVKPFYDAVIAARLNPTTKLSL